MVDEAQVYVSTTETTERIFNNRVWVFIDGSNLYYALREYFGAARIDFSHLVENLVDEDDELFRVIYYNAMPDEDSLDYEPQSNFFSVLSNLPYFTLRIGHIDGNSQRGVKSKMITDIVAGAASGGYDKAILISSDGDLTDTLDFVHQSGCQVVNAFLPQFRGALREECDLFTDISKYIVDPFTKEPLSPV